jgi:hypothetical protein
MNSGKYIVNLLEDTLPKTISVKEETIKLKIVKCLGDEIIEWVEAMLRLMPWRLGCGVRRVWFRWRFRRSGKCFVQRDANFWEPPILVLMGLLELVLTVSFLQEEA